MLLALLENAGKFLKHRKGFRYAGKVLQTFGKGFKIVGKVLRQRKSGKGFKIQGKVLIRQLGGSDVI